MTCNLVSYRAKLLPTTQCFLFFGSGCGKQRQAERRMGNETDAYPHRRTQTTLHTSVKADPNTSRTWVASLRAGLQFRVFQTLEMKRGSDAGSGEEIEPEKEPRVVLSLVQNKLSFATVRGSCKSTCLGSAEWSRDKANTWRRR